MPQSPNQKPPQLPRSWIAIAFVVMAIFLTLSVLGYQVDTAAKTIAYSEVKKMISEGGISSVVLEEHTITLVSGDGDATDGTTFRAVIPVQNDPTLLPLLEAHKIEVMARAPEGTSILAYILPWVLILGFYLWFQRRMMGGLSGPLGRNSLGGLFKGRFSKPTEQKQRITFDNVAGQEQAKREVSELVSFSVNLIGSAVSGQQYRTEFF